MGFGVTRRSLKMALCDRAHTTLYSSSIATMPLSSSLSEILAAYWSKIATPLYSAPPLGVKLSDLCNDPWCRKTKMMGLSDGERILMIRSSVLIQYTCVTDRQIDGIGMAYTRYSIYAVVSKNDVVRRDWNKDGQEEESEDVQTRSVTCDGRIVHSETSRTEST